jgi:hypothetical protein
MPDQLSSLYSEFLEGGYDCVDRVVLNAYFSMGQSGGGFRTWWRELYGSDENLDDNHLMRMAGRFSRRLRAWAKANHVPVGYCSAGERNHEIAEQHLSNHQLKPGLFLISKAPELVWEAQKTGTDKLGQLVPKDPWPDALALSLAARRRRRPLSFARPGAQRLAPPASEVVKLADRLSGNARLWYRRFVQLWIWTPQ